MTSTLGEGPSPPASDSLTHSAPAAGVKKQRKPRATKLKEAACESKAECEAKSEAVPPQAVAAPHQPLQDSSASGAQQKPKAKRAAKPAVPKFDRYSQDAPDRLAKDYT